jgi:hypothetical protein
MNKMKGAVMLTNVAWIGLTAALGVAVGSVLLVLVTGANGAKFDFATWFVGGVTIVVAVGAGIFFVKMTVGEL